MDCYTCNTLLHSWCSRWCKKQTASGAPVTDTPRDIDEHHIVYKGQLYCRTRAKWHFGARVRERPRAAGELDSQ